MALLSKLLEPLTGAGEAAKEQRAGAEASAAATLASTEKNIDFQKWLWGEQTALQQPYMDVGAAALPGLQAAVEAPFTADEMYMDPGYQFRLSEGQKVLEQSAAARGMQLSGRTLKGIGRYAQDYASGEFQNAYQRRQQGISNLQNLALMGQSAASGTAAQGSVMGGNISQSILQGGQAEAQKYKDLGNIGAAQAQSGWSTLMDIGGLAAATYGGTGWGA